MFLKPLLRWLRPLKRVPPTTCPVHQLPLQTRLIQAEQSRDVMPSGYDATRKSSFPFAPFGDDPVEGEPTFPINVCLKCEAEHTRYWDNVLKRGRTKKPE